MSYTDNFDDPIIGKMRKGDADDPYKIISITLPILNGKAVLPEIPSRFEKVKVTGASVSMYEIEDGELANNFYKVDYTEGVVFFNSTHNNKNYTFSFSGMGRHFFPSTGIWVTNDTNGIQTAKEKFDRLESDILAQKNRVDNQINNTPQPSEILDTRVDRNGVVYPVLKTRIDAEQKKIDDALAGKNGTVFYTSLKDRFDKNDDKLETLELSLYQKATKAELTNAVSIKADKTYVDTQISNIGSASPKGTYVTLAALQTAFPTGNSNIYVVTADGKWYYWSGSAWTAGGTYQATGLAENSVSFSKLDSKLVNNQLRRFTIYDSSVTSVFTPEILSGVKYIKLYGFDKTVPHRLRCLARNHSTFKYRIIISALQGESWVDVFDTGTDFTVAENANGFTKLDITIGAKRIVMVVDYANAMNVGVSISDADLTKTKYTISEECFLEDVVVPTKSVSFSQLDDKLVNNQLKLFAINDSTVTSLFDVTKLSAIKYLKLYGFDSSKKHRIRTIARNHSSFKYRIIITQETSTGVWNDVFDTTTSFTITENLKGYTKVDHTIGSKRLVMLIDYASFSNTGDSISDVDLTKSKYTILDDCFVDTATTQTTQTPQKKMVATKTGTTMKVKFKYNDTQNMIIEFGLLGVNALAHMTGIYLENSNTITDSFTNLVTMQSIATDWVSPYGLLAINNPVNAFAGTVGGNHGTDSGAGFPTARRENVTFYADNMLMQDNKIYYCDNVVVKAIHYIAASNTIDLTTGAKRDSVKEFVTYTITPQNIEVSVTLSALEDVKFNRYAGLQAQLTAWNDEGYFMLDKAPTLTLSPGGTLVNSANKNEAVTDRFVAKKGTDYLIGYMNRRVGIGNRNYIGDTYPNAFFSNNGKVYMPSVNGTEMQVNNGESVFWNGGWTFTPKLNCDNAKAAYFINNLGKRVYCVDFFNAGVGYLDVLPEDYNKEIEVVYKDSTITCDTFTISKGLKVQSTGYGQLKFTIK
jgi:hypothetical protein